ncbi:MAG: DUF4031 domain-containing protein [Ferruginibacter sp.]
MVYIGTREWKYRGMLMSHMIADTLSELHDMAELIGVDKRHFQDKLGKPHYDVCKQNKQKAIAAGAKEIDDRQIIEILRSFKK